MKKLYNILKYILWCLIGAYIGSSVYKYYHFKTYPDLYAMQSAPWYLSIIINTIIIAVIVFIIIGIMYIIKKK